LSGKSKTERIRSSLSPDHLCSTGFIGAIFLGFEIVVKPVIFCNDDKGSLLKWNTYRRSYIDASLATTKISIGMSCILPTPCMMNWKVVHYLLNKAFTSTSYMARGKGTLMYGEGFFMMLGAWLTCVVAFALIFNKEYKWGFHGHWTIDADEHAHKHKHKHKGAHLSKAAIAQEERVAMIKEIEDMFEPAYSKDEMSRNIKRLGVVPALKLLWPMDSVLRFATFFTETFSVKVVAGLAVISIALVTCVLLFDEMYESGWCRIFGKLATANKATTPLR
jgi:hypothetical protein